MSQQCPQHPDILNFVIGVYLLSHSQLHFLHGINQLVLKNTEVSRSRRRSGFPGVASLRAPLHSAPSPSNPSHATAGLPSFVEIVDSFLK